MFLGHALTWFRVAYYLQAALNLEIVLCFSLILSAFITALCQKVGKD